jgi:Xaa-Pro aminopeptidase
MHATGVPLWFELPYCRQANMTTRFLFVALLFVSAQAVQPPQPYFTDVFPIDEFAARRAKVMEQIGQGVAVIQGAPEMAAEVAFRQNNHFFYLTGVEVPRAILVMDGRAKRSTLYLAPPRRERYNGPELGPGDAAARITGIASVVDRDAFAAAVAQLAQDPRVLFTPFRAEVRGGGSAGEASGHARATSADPWDGRPSRETAFKQKLQAAAPNMEIKDLDPILDALRFVKTPREIALMREVTRITGLGIMEAMREAAPGKYEYELSAAAEWVFRRHNSQGPGYFPLSATGPNTVYSHYHRGLRKLQDGEIVQFDYAPDLKYYTSDISRIFPANGAFTARQRELYTIYLRMYQALMTSIKPGIPITQVASDAGKKMEEILAGFTFTDSKIKDAATRFAAQYQSGKPRTSLGHALGMEVHDVTIKRESFQPGELFTIEPPISIPDENLAMRIEDVILITEKGFENLSAFVPIEVDGIEKLMREPGIGARK